MNTRKPKKTLEVDAPLSNNLFHLGNAIYLLGFHFADKVVKLHRDVAELTNMSFHVRMLGIVKHIKSSSIEFSFQLVG